MDRVKLGDFTRFKQHTADLRLQFTYQIDSYMNTCSHKSITISTEMEYLTCKQSLIQKPHFMPYLSSVIVQYSLHMFTQNNLQHHKERYPVLFIQC